jgi:hypothetical protein
MKNKKKLKKKLFFELRVAEIPPKHETATNLSRQQTSLLGSGTPAAGGRLFGLFLLTPSMLSCFIL